MIAQQHLVPFLIASFLIILAPGPSVLFAIARAISWGRAVATVTVAGNALGMLVLSALVAFGLGPVLQNSALLYSIVQWGGGGYLVWLGIDAIRHRHVAAAEMTDISQGLPTKWQTMRQGFVVGVLNPKAIVFFAAIFPEFVDRSMGNVTLQLLTMGAIFSGMAFISDGTWGLIAGTAREWLSSDSSRLVSLRVGGGLVMVGLGIAILVTSPLPW